MFPVLKLRKHLRVCVIVLTVAFSFISIEWHTDHDLNAKAPAHHCCLQCCPSHNLAPLSTHGISLSAPSVVAGFVELTDSFQQDLILNKIYRPPIA